MTWKTVHDEMLCQEILVVDPFTGTKKGTVARGTKWEEVALNQEPINRSLHVHCILESTFARIFLFLELPFLQEAQFYRENLSQSSSLKESSDLPAIIVTFRRDQFM